MGNIFMRLRRDDWSTAQNVVTAACLFSFTLLTYVLALHVNRSLYFDEVVLLNASYIIEETGRLGYPMHGFPDSMTVHPPLHYTLIAIGSWMGLSPLSSAGAVAFLLSLLCMYVLLRGRFSFIFVSAFLLSLYLSLWIWSDTYFVRPDLSVTLVYLTSVLALVSGVRLGSRWRLILGGTLVGALPFIHYWALGAVVLIPGATAYITWQAKHHGALRDSWRTVLAPAAGFCLIVVPGLAFYVFPNAYEIAANIRSVQERSASAINRHLESYQAFVERLTFDFGDRLLADVILWLPLATGIPAIILSLLLLAFARETRLFAFAASTLPLFVLLVSRGKQVGYTGYFSIELVLFAFSILYLVFLLVGSLVGTMRRTTISVVVAGVAILTFASQPVATASRLPGSLVDRIATLDILRASSQFVLGVDPTVALVSAGGWYTGGGNTVWNAFNELHEARVAGGREAVTNLLNRADAVTIDSVWWNGREDLVPIARMYRDGELNLVGAVLPRQETERHLLQVFVSPGGAGSVRIVVPDDEFTAVFTQAPRIAARHTFGVFFCPDSDPRGVDMIDAMYWYQMSYDQQQDPGAPSMMLLLAEETEFATGMKLLSTCELRDELPLVESQIDTATLVQMEGIDEAISFHQRSDEFVEPSTFIGPVAP